MRKFAAAACILACATAYGQGAQGASNPRVPLVYELRTSLYTVSDIRDLGAIGKNPSKVELDELSVETYSQVDKTILDVLKGFCESKKAEHLTSQFCRNLEDRTVIFENSPLTIFGSAFRLTLKPQSVLGTIGLTTALMKKDPADPEQTSSKDWEARCGGEEREDTVRVIVARERGNRAVVFVIGVRRANG